MITGTRINKLEGDPFISFLCRAQQGRRGNGGTRIGDKKAGVKRSIKNWGNRTLRYKKISFE